MRNLIIPILLLAFILPVAIAQGQTIIDNKVQQIEQDQNNSSLYQLYLNEPAKKIQKLEYESSDDKLEGELSNDGKVIYLKNYKPKSRVKVSVVYNSGKKDTFTRSSCYIDPVIPIL